MNGNAAAGSGDAADHGDIAWAEIHALDRDLRLEYAWIAPHRAGTPLLVFLHEGLGSIAMWKDWPRRVCDAAHCRGLVFSRYGYGRSTPRPPAERWPLTYLHEQARQVLPALFTALGIDARQDRLVLFGHSDGGSIALLYAAMYPDAVAGIAVAAPHIFVEDVTVSGIGQARTAYLETTLRDKLGRYHADPDSAFWGWSDVWLNPGFRQWDIQAYLPKITCPILALQGVEDEYGTLEQIRGIRRLAPQTRLIELPGCGHSPHKDQPQAVIQAVADFAGGLDRTG